MLIPGTGGMPDWLDEIDYRRLKPTAMLHVHTTDRALAGADGCPQTARVEGAGPITVSQGHRFLGNPFITIRINPVFDPADVPPVDAYEISNRTREAVRLRHLTDSFPFGVSATRQMDLDHTIPWEQGGPTSRDNLSPLSRHHHRAKTHGGWGKRQPNPETVVWRSPHGWIYLVTPQGTLDLGRNPYARAVWHAAKPADQPSAGSAGTPTRQLELVK